MLLKKSAFLEQKVQIVSDEFSMQFGKCFISNQSGSLFALNTRINDIVLFVSQFGGLSECFRVGAGASFCVACKYDFSINIIVV